MNTILQSVFLKALGWSLVDSLWQLGIVWLIYFAGTRRGRKFSADKRHNLALLSLAAGSAWFLGTLFYRMAGDGEFYTGLSVASVTGSLHGFVEPALPFLSVLYLVVAMVLAGRLYGQFKLTQKLSTSGISKAAPELRVFLKQMAMQLGIRKNVKIWISSLVETPLTIGFFKPVILLPVAIVNHLSIAQTESIILHELYHIRRNDFLVNLVIAVADVFLFFNPFAKFFREVIEREREHSCDDIVVQFRYSATGYAQALLTLEQQRPSRQKVALAATGTDQFVLLARVKRVLTGENAPAPFNQRLVAFLFSALMLGYIGLYTPGQLLLNPESVLAATEIPVMQVADAGNEQHLQEFETAQPAARSLALKPDTESKPEEIITEEPQFDDELEKSLAKVIVTEKIGRLIYDAANTAGTDVAFVKEADQRDYSINFEEKPTEVIPDKAHPYVPGNSFTYRTTTEEPVVIVNDEKNEIA
ncbi:MAG: M56 family metallopeptidase, partial [Flavitalea sp.]